MRRSLLLAVVLLAIAGAASAGKKAPAPAARLSETGRTNLALAQAYLEGNKLKDAEDRARKALASDPGHPRVHAFMGVVYARMKQPEKAQHEFSRALDLGPGDATVHNLYGTWQCERGDHAGADQSFQTALVLRGNSRAQVLSNAGRCAVRARDWNKARSYLREAVKLVPSDRNVLMLLAETELQLGRTLEARAFVQRSDALGPDASTLALAARVEDAAGDAVAAARYRKRLREEFPGYASAAEGVRQQ
jgi:type IV pilus assembly protein PilF